jgi:hypothetical protein
MFRKHYAEDCNGGCLAIHYASEIASQTASNQTYEQS